MRLVAALADRHAVSVFLQAHSEFLDIPPAASIIDGDEEWDHPQDRLVGFYRRHGFVVLHDQGDTVDMIRHPRAPDPEGQAALDRALNGEPLDWPGRSRNPAP